MPQLTEWLKLMVAEINRKREDADAARKEDAARATPQKDLPSAEPRRSN
jgi:hypothetical protein